jgi:signal transduction histidine kinase
MQSWLPFFVIVASVSIILQTLILAAMFFQFRRQGRRVEQIAEELRTRVMPILGRVQALVEDAQPKISSMLSDATEITRVARTQVQRVDRVMVEAVDRLRLQLVHADQILTGTLETIEDTGAKLRKTLWGPIQSASAVVRGIQVGLEFFRGMRMRRPPESPVEQPDESLFI